MSLSRGLAVLELLADRQEVRLAELARLLGVSRATAHRILATLQERGFVEHYGDEHVYRLGPAVASLAVKAATASLVTLTRPAMADLHVQTGETINLALLRRGRITWAATIDAVHAIRLTTTIGERVPPNATAIGKAILATMPAAQRASLLGPEPYHRLTSRTLTTLTELGPDLASATGKGYAVDDGESEVGGVCIAAPILAPDGRPLGAISVSAIEARLPANAWPRVGQLVRNWCARIGATVRADPTASRSGRSDQETS